ncbi:uncharacterized protein LOC116169178 [Photinus pyralis]|uniref:uncharacterized protein LOC116169178 n=1 Tax=Photinus pyralis TaxID=7054 RepID=UPI0012670679|nr:uncharacterized protein LOC116169178 [Photinus pyralis]
MAKILDTDPILYAKERDGFLRDLQHFHETRGTPFRRAPTINGHEIDLYLLYCLVTEEGGWIKVSAALLINKIRNSRRNFKLSGVRSEVSAAGELILYLARSGPTPPPENARVPTDISSHFCTIKKVNHLLRNTQ